MVNPIPPSSTCATAWLAAAQRLVDVSEAYNVIVDIDNPVLHPTDDVAVIMAVDQFLRDRDANPIATVANTIFPQDLYRRHQGKELYAEYEKRYDLIRKKGWGRYFNRMIRWPTGNGKTMNQLQHLIERLKTGMRSRQTFKSVYELTLFDPVNDKNRNRNRQCLSFLSFKLHPDRGLMLTAMYRNHHYIARALGNFIGLGQLMAFIAAEAGTTVGPLTCVSTHAELDVANGHWNKQDAKNLIAAIVKQRAQSTAHGASSRRAG